jgi:hypothetical protein
VGESWLDRPSQRFDAVIGIPDSTSSASGFRYVASSQRPCRSRVDGLASRSQDPEVTSPYLDRPLVPLAVALPRMLEKIEAELATAGPAESLAHRQRADMIRLLLTPSRSTTPP